MADVVRDLIKAVDDADCAHIKKIMDELGSPDKRFGTLVKAKAETSKDSPNHEPTITAVIENYQNNRAGFFLEHKKLRYSEEFLVAFPESTRETFCDTKNKP